MYIDSIKNGYVIDHIKAGKSLDIYNLLELDKASCPVAVIQNAPSKKMGKKDIIKIDADINLSLDVLGYIAPDITINIIKDGKLCEKKHLELPKTIENICICKNPRCITSTEQELPQIFKLTDKDNKVYRCIYCDSKLKK